MKKIFAIALALVMVLGIATSALAVSWGAPTVTSSSSPFAAEVIKLGANSGVTGSEYYSVLTDAAAYDYSNIFYAIKLSVPSAAQANDAYSGAKYSVGDKVKVTITYTNVSGKSSDTKYVTVGSAAKTLWYNGKLGQFEESWVPSVTNSCGCGDQHVMKATATGNKEVKIKVCFAAKGELKDIKIAGCYGVEKKTYCGVKPCVNCKPQDLTGFVFSGDCARFKVFFATNAAGKVTGVYAIDDLVAKDTNSYGTMKEITTKLYGWMPVGTDCDSCNDVNNLTKLKFELQPLSKGTVLTAGLSTWTNESKMRSGTGVGSSGWVKAMFREDVDGAKTKLASTVVDKWEDGTEKTLTRSEAEYNQVYIANKDGNFVEMGAAWYDKFTDDLDAGDYLYRNAKASTTSHTSLITPYTTTTTGDTNVVTLKGAALPVAKDDGRFMPKADNDQKDWSVYAHWTLAAVYGEMYYFCYDASNDQLFQQLTADKISCDTNEAAYLNAINHLYSVLGFTYADVAAGNVYMTEDILLANFGFAIAPCSEAVWGAYTAAITVASVAEVPATGSVAFAGFAMLALAIGAAVASKKNA